MGVTIAGLSKLIREKKAFALEGNIYSQISFSKLNKGESDFQKERTARLLNSIAIKAIQEGNPSANVWSDIAFQYAKRHVKPIHGKTMLYYESYALLFKNAIKPNVLADLETKQLLKRKTLLSGPSLDREVLWKELVDQNNLHYVMNASGVELDKEELSLPVKGDLIKLKEMELVKDLKNKQIVWRNKGAELFRTNFKSKLEGYHFHGISGILPGTISKPVQEYIHAQFKKVKSSGKYKILICSSVTRPGVTRFLGPHGYLGLEDTQGNQSFYGRFILPFTKAHIEVPDRYTCVPLTQKITTIVERVITRAQYEQLKKDIDQDVFEAEKYGSYLKGNCTGFVVRKAASVGVKINAKVSNVEWLFLNLIQLLPKFLKMPLKKGYESLPSIIKKALHFLVFPLYVTSVVGNLIFWVGSLFDKRLKKDISLINIFFRPWRIYSNHPMKLYEWQQKQLRRQNGKV